jgi:DNA-binding Lrp family transcriptional regulator
MERMHGSLPLVSGNVLSKITLFSLKQVIFFPFQANRKLAMDKRDISILRALQDDGRTTNTALSKQLNIAEAPTWRRVKALEDAGLITGYRAVLNQHALGYEVTAFVRIRFSSHDPKLQAAFEAQVLQISEVVWCHNVSGNTDFLLCVVARNLQEYGQFVSARLRVLPGVTSIESSFSLKAVKDGGKLPIG